ncbi:class I SAM-dependent methyltransferase [Cognatiluteimonas profundi]|uniref:class I SAM-dependent methyltransferase n=1 Tax=Cognatiluteimonas profundi TaxID=2594501 RepID=UPI00131E8A58|nr:class I SAM-dependent methyltransferase [Lysobacter profundi]
MAVDAVRSDGRAGGGSKVAWSCLVDDTPQIWSSITPWLATAVGLAGIDPTRMYVHHVCPLRPEVASLCAALGVNVVAVPAFDARSPHSNKIRQCQGDYGDADRVALTDVDIVFARDVPLATITAPVAGKLVDGPNPPVAVLERIFAEAGMAVPARFACGSWNAQSQRIAFETVGGNFNGGLYVVDAPLLAALGARWAHWAHWLLDRVELLDKWRVHVDQVSFCLALAEAGKAFQILSDAWNFPTHRPVDTSADEPILLHHHGRLDAHMRLQQVDAPQARPAIARVNRTIEQFQRRYFDNRGFWNHRYAHHPALGSGQGSRGEILERKRALLAALIPRELSVLDWGCGDLETTRDLPCRDYVGVDLSIEALRIAAAKQPSWTFATPADFDAGVDHRRDVVLCLDVLIHQPDPAAYRALVGRLLGRARRGALVSGFDRDPGIGSHITYFHEPLSRTIAAMPGVAAMVPLLEYRDTTLYFVAVGDEPMTPADGEAAQAFARRVLSGTLPDQQEGPA